MGYIRRLLELYIDRFIRFEDLIIDQDTADYLTVKNAAGTIKGWYSNLRLNNGGTIQSETGAASNGYIQAHNGSIYQTVIDLINGYARLVRVKLVESGGPTDLLIGPIVDGEYLRRNGNTIDSGSPTVDPITTLDETDDFLLSSAETGEIGKWGWMFTSGAVDPFDAEPNHPGVIRCQTLSSISTRHRLHLGSNPGDLKNVVDYDDEFDITYVLELPSIISLSVTIGLTVSISSDTPNTCVMFTFDPAVSSYWKCLHRTNGTEQDNEVTDVTAAANTWYKLRVMRDGTDIKFYINDVLKKTYGDESFATSFCPALAVTNNVASNKELRLDLCRLRVPNLSRY